MANDVQIDKLSIEVGADAGNAAATLDALSAALDRLAKTGRLTRIQNNLNGLRNQLKGFESINSSIAAIERLKTTLNGLSGIQNAKGLSSTVNVLKRFPEIAAQLQGVNFDGFRENVASLSAAFEHLGTVDKASGLASTVNALKKIPDITSQLNPETIREFGVAAQGVRDAIQPLATEIDRLGTGFSRLPTNIQRVITANQRLVNSGNQVINNVNQQGNGLARTAIRWGAFGIALRTAARYIGQSLNNFNEYVENVNLFSVSMGEYTQQAAEFAQRMQDVLGVDAGEAMRNMGLIQNLTTSFGMASDQAYILSKNITQLGYDFASFYNISSEEAFTKLQAAISGELEPIRRLGIDISTARLQQELFNLGIEANVNELNQADKSMLRYIAIMKQSTNAQTDMARTLNSPANMMRVFNAQVQLLARSIGSLFIPMLNAVLPPLIAFIQVVREAISAIASLFGVEVKFADVTSSVAPSLGGVSDDIGDIGSSAAKSAKEIRMLIGGFDELNVLPEKTEPAGGGGAGGAGGSLLGDIELPQYDMFDGLVKGRVAEYVDKIKNAFKKLKDILKPVMPLIKGVMAALTTGAVLAGITKLVSKVKDLWSKLKALKGVGAIAKGIQAFVGAMQLGATPSIAFGEGLKVFRKELGVLGQAFVGIVSAVGAFVTAFDAAYKYTTGEMSGIAAAINIGVGALAAFAATALAINVPVGIAVAAFATLAGAIAGAIKAENDMRKDAFNAAFYDGVGISITKLADSYVSVFDAVSNANQPILDNAAAIEQSKDKIADVGNEIGVLIWHLENGTQSVETLAPQITEQFSLLESETSSILDRVYDNISRALAGSLSDVLVEMGYSVPEIASLLGNVVAGAKESMATLKQEEEEVIKSMSNGTYSADEAATMLSDIYSRMRLYTGETSAELGTFNNFMSEDFLNTIDFENEAAFRAAMEDMSAAADSARQSIDDSHGEIKSSIENIISIATLEGYSDEDISYFRALIDANNRDWVNQRGEIDKSMQTAAGYIEESFGNKMEKIAEETGPSTWQRFLGSFTGGEGVRRMVNDEILKNFEGLDESFEKTFAQYGEPSLTGYADSLLENGHITSEATKSAMEVADIAARNYLGIHSPSDLFEYFGANTIYGFRDGIKKNVREIENAIEILGRRTSATMATVISDLQRQASQASIVINVVTEYSTRGTPAAGVSAPRGRTISNMVPFGNVPALAGGGVLYKPRLVLAGEYANARSNPEIIAPQSMMRETVSEANEQSNREEIRVLQQILVALQRGNQKIVINGRELFEVMQEEQRRDQMRTGSVYG